MMWARRLSCSSHVSRLARGFGGGHGGHDHQIDPHSSVDQHYLKHYGEQHGDKAHAQDNLLAKFLSPKVHQQVQDELSNSQTAPQQKKDLYEKIRSAVILDKLFERIVPKSKESPAGQNDPYKGLSASDRYAVQLMDIYKRTESPTRYTVTNFLKNLSPSTSKRVLEYFYSEVDAIGAEREVADEFNPPKIHENSIFLYQSTAKATRMKLSRAAEVPAAALLYALWPHPMLTTTIIALTYMIMLRASHFEVAKRFVTRMDLLPHLEMVAFQKVGPFGRPVTRLVRIQDLEKVEPEFSKENAFWNYNIWLDNDLMYKDKSTGELFLFDRSGYWNWEGISHKLLY